MEMTSWPLGTRRVPIDARDGDAFGAADVVRVELSAATGTQ